MDAENPIYWQDEVLQLLYWMRGEKLADEVAPEEIHRFLGIKPETLESVIDRLAELDLVEWTGNTSSGRIRLTEQGVQEGKKRFLEEFEDYLGHESHLVCDDPDCDCHAPDFEGVCHHLIDRQPPHHES